MASQCYSDGLITFNFGITELFWGEGHSKRSCIIMQHLRVPTQTAIILTH